MPDTRALGRGGDERVKGLRPNKIYGEQEAAKSIKLITYVLHLQILLDF